MSTPDLTGAAWRKASRSDANGGACVEVADLGDSVAVRDSKHPTGPVLLFTPDAWTAFVDLAKAGGLDR